MSHRLSGVPVNLLVAILILFSIFIFTFTLVFTTIVVPGYKLTNSFRVRPSGLANRCANESQVAYNIASAIIATVLARYASGEIQKQWLRQINHEISDVKYQLHHSPHIRQKWRAVSATDA